MQILRGDLLPRVFCTGRPWFPFLRGSSAATPRMSSSWLRQCAFSHVHFVQEPTMSGAVCPHARVDQRVLVMNRRSVRGQPIRHHGTPAGQVVLNGDWWPSLSPVGTPLFLPACCLRRLEGLVHLPSLQTVAQLGPVDRHLTHGSRGHGDGNHRGSQQGEVSRHLADHEHHPQRGVRHGSETGDHADDDETHRRGRWPHQ